MTKPVPSTSESGMLRFGFFTSPAVKVMLFHASAEKSEPHLHYCKNDEEINEHSRPADAYLHRVQIMPARIRPETGSSARRNWRSMPSR